MRLKINQAIYDKRTDEIYMVKPVIEVTFVRFERDLPDANGQYHKEPVCGMLAIDRDGTVWAIPNVSEDIVEKYSNSMLATDMADVSNFANAYAIENYPSPDDEFVIVEDEEE